jgi:ABC-type phosphate transport system substrate-binding protein
VYVGSTGFLAIAQAAAAVYRQDCPNSTISFQRADSAYGLSQLRKAIKAHPGQAVPVVAAYDGTSTEAAGFKAYPVAALILAVVAHKGTFSSPSVSTGVLRDIFTGAGGPDYVEVERLSGSATRLNLFRKVLGIQQPPPFKAGNCIVRSVPDVGVKRCIANGTSDMLTFVAKAPHSVGYVVLSGMDLAKYPQLSVMDIDNVAPTAANVRNGKYNFWAVEHLFTASQPTPLVADFVDFVQNFVKTITKDNVISCLGAPESVQSDCRQ